MRILATFFLVSFSLLSVGCDVILQPAQQGEWSNFHNDKHKISKDAEPTTEKALAPAEK